MPKRQGSKLFVTIPNVEENVVAAEEGHGMMVDSADLGVRVLSKYKFQKRNVASTPRRPLGVFRSPDTSVRFLEGPENFAAGEPASPPPRKRTIREMIEAQENLIDEKSIDLLFASSDQIKHKEQQLFSSRYNFDVIDNEGPLPGRFEWFKVAEPGTPKTKSDGKASKP